MDAEKFKTAVRNSSYIDPNELMKLWEKYGMRSDGLVTMEDADRMKKSHRSSAETREQRSSASFRESRTE